ncbi:hypothetical protein EV368DRAFT_68136 [Lentinula lateritia]|uniref:Uncharacterized protein n=1 Tax=Lentinula aff. lateritia TaxID=2804960 RepID=A0ACC1U081_9AGAR|nr:hypothetical protein F5876DRAFT_65640 [Lentinula aff. lateritia]KAJ3848604.1 hypothetical protein EV368DRAFT_68136 [Lentinula lateritia]
MTMRKNTLLPFTFPLALLLLSSPPFLPSSLTPLTAMFWNWGDLGDAGDGGYSEMGGRLMIGIGIGIGIVETRRRRKDNAYVYVNVPEVVGGKIKVSRSRLFCEKRYTPLPRSELSESGYDLSFIALFTRITTPHQYSTRIVLYSNLKRIEVMRGVYHWHRRVWVGHDGGAV